MVGLENGHIRKKSHQMVNAEEEEAEEESWACPWP